MDDKNLIPAAYASGSFEAISPFNAVVDPSIYYTVEAVRTVDEMLSDKINLYTLVFQPVGVQESDYETILNRCRDINAVVVVLTAPGRAKTYVLSSYLKSFPLVDGYSYERMCLIADLGAVPPEFANVLAEAQKHFADYLEANVGIKSTVHIGTIPTTGYTSKKDHDIFETTRKNKINMTQNDVTRVKELEAVNQEQGNRIVYLEEQLKKLAG
jgi:hypothetical protein